MREIKFRFWSKYLDAFAIPDDDIFVGALKDPKMVVMQYTGFKDKNGKEVYEGDICHYYKKNYRAFDADKERTFRVGWSESQGRWGINDSNIPLAHFENENLEIVGNIYEDPELLEAKRA